jgi:hypothetical protein
MIAGAAVGMFVLAAVFAFDFGRRGILIWSVAGEFVADTNIYNDTLGRNLQAVGFHKCDYLTGLSVFTTLDDGEGCRRFAPATAALSNVRPRPRSESAAPGR